MMPHAWCIRGTARVKWLSYFECPKQGISEVENIGRYSHTAPVIKDYKHWNI